MNSRRFLLLKRFLRGNTRWFAWSLVFLIASIAVDMLTPLFLMFVIDSVLGTAPINLPQPLMGWVMQAGGRDFLLNNLWLLGAGLVVLSFLSGGLGFLRGRFTAIAGETVAKGMRESLYGHLQRLDYEYHVKAETGDLIQRCSSDVETVRHFLAGQIIEMCRAVILVVISLIVLLPISGSLTAWAVCVTPAILAFTMGLFKQVVTRFKVADEAEGSMSASLQESVSGVRVVRAFGRERFEMEKFEGKSIDVREGWKRLTRFNAIYWPVGDMLSNIQVAVTLGCSVYFAVAGRISVGVMLLFLQYSGRLIWPIRQLGRILSELGRAQVALDRIDEILCQKPERDDDGDLTPPINADVVFDHVTFSYQPAQPVLRDLSFVAKAGQTVAILGATGSGKSSIMLLMQRLYTPQSGTITIGGVPIERIQKRHLRERVGIVLQEPFLYSRSIKANIAMARADADEEELHDAARTAHAEQFILDFDKGYDTMVGERGVTLSGGQKQRAAIARTLLKQTDILIFDDSLSAVDTETDAAIRASLREKRKGITTFIVSHRIATLQEADVILVLENGAVAQRGTHDELIAREGLYKRIYEIQTSLEDEYRQDEAGETHAVS